jgi:heptaprenyl diphosphate synthase
MTRSHTDPNSMKKIAALTAMASALQVAESFLPHPIPGVKLGLANMIVLIALVDMGFAAAFEIAIMRTIISSLMMGTFLSPGFVLSFAASAASCALMGLMYGAQKKTNVTIFSLTGISIAGSITHNSVQLALVFLFLIKSKGVLLLMPWLGISAVVMGFITGIAASKVCAQIDKYGAKKPIRIKEEKEGVALSRKVNKKSLLHSVPAVYKIAFVFLMAIAVLMIEKPLFYLALTIFIILAAVFAGAAKEAVSGVRFSWGFILFSFLMPIIFSPPGDIITSVLGIKITVQGLHDGVNYALRIAILVISSSLAFKTSTADETAAGIKIFIRPLSFIGIKADRSAFILTHSLHEISGMWVRAKTYLNSGKKKGFMNSLAGVILALYIPSKERAK